VKGKGESKSGYYSSHGVMVPMGPAFDSDGSKYLGRPRRPRYSGSSGSPSMHADSGFSSTDGLGRVNKGYDQDVEMPPMFPEQEDEYADDEDLLNISLRTRKLPVYSIGVHPNSGKRGIKNLSEGFLPSVIGDFFKSLGLSAPGIDVLIGKMILDREAESGRVAIENMCDLVGISSNDLGASLIDPSDGPMITIIQRICSMDDQQRLDARDLFREFLKSLKDAIVTLVQAYDSLVVLGLGQLGPQAATPEEIATVPAVNFMSGITGFFTRSLPVERLVFSLSSNLARMFVNVIEISDTLEAVSPEYKEAISRLDSGFGPVFSAIRSSPALSLSRLGTLYAGLSGEKTLCLAQELPKTVEAEDEIVEDVPVEPEIADPSREEISDRELGAAAAGVTMLSDQEDLGFPEAAGCACPISESRFRLLENRYNKSIRSLGMSESTLRIFVEEIVKEAKRKSDESSVQDSPSRYGGQGYLPHPGMAYGQRYLPASEEDEEEFLSDEEERLHAGDDFAVSYRADDGYSAWQARPESLSEREIRAIIKQELNESLSDIMPDRLKKGIATAGIAGTLGIPMVSGMGALSVAGDVMMSSPESTMQEILDDMEPEDRLKKATDVLKGTDDQVNSLPNDLKKAAYQVASDYLDSQQAQDDLSIPDSGQQSDISMVQTQPMESYYEGKKITRSQLRRIIKEEERKLLQNDDSKKKDEEKDDLDEFSVSAGVAGVVTPLGTGPDGGKGNDGGARERSIHANERGYGGGKRSGSWMTYPIKGY